jgi:hypothetical protein
MGVGVHAELEPGATGKAVRISTRTVPVAEAPAVAAPTATEIPALEGVVLDMKLLAETPPEGFGPRLGPLVSASREWIESETVRIGDFKDLALEAMKRCTEAFRFLNRAMWQ